MNLENNPPIPEIGSKLSKAPGNVLEIRGRHTNTDFDVICLANESAADIPHRGPTFAWRIADFGLLCADLV